MTGSSFAHRGPRTVLAAFAVIFALAHIPFLASSLEDIDSVNFALGLRHFDVAQHRPHPPGYPVYIALGKVAAAVTGMVSHASQSAVEARALSILSLLGALLAIGCMYVVFASLNDREPRELDVAAMAATAITATTPLFWYLAVRPMSDAPGFAVGLAAQACLAMAWLRQRPGPDGDRRMAPAQMAASGRMIVIGAFLAAFSIGLRSQTLWYTFPLLALVIADRIGRGVAGAMVGGGIMFAAGGLLWGIPLLIASGGLNAYLAALGGQAGEDFAGVDMLFYTHNLRAGAFALVRTFVYPWEFTPLAVVVLILAVAGVVRLSLHNRRSLLAVVALSGPYLLFHLLFQDTAFIRYALPIMPFVAFLAVQGVGWFSSAAVPPVAAVISIGGAIVASPVLVAYASSPSPSVQAVAAINAEAATAHPGALAMHQTFVRPLEAEDVAVKPQLPAPPRQEWLELVKYWKSGHREPLWFLGDPQRSDLALIDPASRRDVTAFDWPIVTRPAFGGLRPAAARWYRMPLPGWFAEVGWSLTPETSGIARVMGKGPHLGPITAMVHRRPDAARVMVGGRNLGAPGDPHVTFTMLIDGAEFQQWDAAPGFFLKVFEIPAGRLAGTGEWATLTIQSTPVSGNTPVESAIEQFDLQNADALMWGYDEGWQEAEFNQSLGVWRWTSERATLRIIGPPRAVHVTMTIESPLRYFDEAPLVRASAGGRELAVSTIADGRDWMFDVPADALAASGGAITIETDKTFVPAERGSAPDRRHLGLRVFAISVANSLTSTESPR